MCSRFCIDQEMWRELKELFGDLDRMFSGWKWNRNYFYLDIYAVQ